MGSSSPALSEWLACRREPRPSLSPQPGHVQSQEASPPGLGQLGRQRLWRADTWRRTYPAAPGDDRSARRGRPWIKPAASHRGLNGLCCTSWPLAVVNFVRCTGCSLANAASCPQVSISTGAPLLYPLPPANDYFSITNITVAQSTLKRLIVMLGAGSGTVLFISPWTSL